MFARSSVSVFLLAIVAGLLLLFSSHDASAISYKIVYTMSLSSTTAGANADITSNLSISAPYTNFTKLDTTNVPSEWTMATDAEVSDGAAIGQVVATSTLAVVGACTTTVMVTIPLFDATTAETNTADWVVDGSNLTQDADGNGLPTGVDKYPSFLNTIFGGLKPRGRAFGYTSAIAGAPPTQLNFVVFNPGQFVGASGWPGLAKPEQEIGDAIGYENFVVLNNPVAKKAGLAEGTAAPSSIQEFCVPLATVTTTWGKTKGEGETILKVGGAEVTGQCATSQVGVDNDGDGIADDGCIVVTDTCFDAADSPVAINDGCPARGAVEATCNETSCADADGLPPWDNCDNDADTMINDGCAVAGASREMSDACANNTDDEPDNDFDGWTDEDCDILRAANPANNTGIFGGNTHLFHAYSHSQRDFDADGIPNNEDGCPATADRQNVGGDPNADTSREIGAECGNLLDDDGDGPTGVVGAPCLATDLWCNDGCPASGNRTVEKDTDGDAIGDVCDPTPGGTVATCTDGSPQNDDQDCDGYKNRQDNCPLVVNGCKTAACHATLFNAAWDDQLDADTDRCDNSASDDGADDALANDGCPVVGTAPESATQCSNTTDDDGDGSVNDGCPMAGSMTETCVNGTGSTADWGPCNDGIGDACETSGGLSPTVADGAYAKDLVIAPVCIGAAGDDTDTDGWCNATECVGTFPACTGGFGSDPGSAASTPEHTAIDYKVGGLPMDPVPSTCNDFQYYVSTGDDIAAAAAVDNDGNGTNNATEADGADSDLINDCANMVWDGTDQDGVAPDGETGAQCDNATDDDVEGKVNDRCPALGAAETVGAQCDNATNDDTNTEVNDGCPVVGTFSEGANWCGSPLDGIDQDNDATADDGCPGGPAAVGVSEAANHCADVVNDDPGDDALVNDGCPQLGTVAETAGECANAINDDDTTEINDGCPAVDATRWNRIDACPADWNPEQLNTDAIDDAIGDACDPDDDADGPTDIAEWKRGTDPKNFQSPRIFDVNNDGAVNINDVLSFGGAVDTSYRLQPMVGQGKMQPWTYAFVNNTGFAIDRLRIEFWDGAKVVSVSDGTANTWSCKPTGLQKLGCRTAATQTLANGGMVTLKAYSNAQRELVCWQWLTGTTARGGSWNSTDCAGITFP